MKILIMNLWNIVLILATLSLLKVLLVPIAKLVWRKRLQTRDIQDFGLVYPILKNDTKLWNEFCVNATQIGIHNQSGVANLAREYNTLAKNKTGIEDYGLIYPVLKKDTKLWNEFCVNATKCSDTTPNGVATMAKEYNSIAKAKGKGGKFGNDEEEVIIEEVIEED